MKTFREFISEAKDETEIGITGQPIPKKKMSAAKRYEFEKKRRENLKKKPGETGDSKLIQALRDKAKKEGTFVEENGSPYQEYKGKPQPKPSAPPEGWEEFKKKYLHGKMSEKKKPEQ